MAKIDRLGWAGGLTFMSHGLRIGVRVNNPAVLDQLTALMPPGATVPASPIVDVLYSLIISDTAPDAKIRRYNLLYLGAARLARTMDFNEVLSVLESDLHFQVALQAKDRLFVHAGVVGWQGRAIVVPGRSQAGKSSLVAALVKAGATYYSDEYAVLDAWGYVHPYAKRISLRAMNGDPARKLTAEELGGSAGAGPLPIGMVVVARFQAGASWRPRPLSRGQALLALLDNTVLARSRSSEALEILGSAVAGAVAVKGKRGEAEQVSIAVLRRLEQVPVAEAPGIHRR
jgi:hypothetical protein